MKQLRMLCEEVASRRIRQGSLSQWLLQHLLPPKPNRTSIELRVANSVAYFRFFVSGAVVKLPGSSRISLLCLAEQRSCPVLLAFARKNNRTARAVPL